MVQNQLHHTEIFMLEEHTQNSAHVIQNVKMTKTTILEIKALMMMKCGLF